MSLRPIVVLTGLLALLLAGCSGSAPPRALDPAIGTLHPGYAAAYDYLRMHPEVRSFAMRHLDQSEAFMIEVSPQVVPPAYASLLAPLLRQEHGLAEPDDAPELAEAVRDSLTALQTAQAHEPFELAELALLSRRQRHPILVFFSRPADNRIVAQLFPNPYRRQSFDTVRQGTPGLALLMELDANGRVTSCLVGEIEPW
jgi:hypothetical protein